MDWDKVLAKELKPPIDVTNFKAPNDFAEEYGGNLFIDYDYSSLNANVDRYSNITFTAPDN